MGKGNWTHPEHATLAAYTVNEVAQHTNRNDRWIIIDDYVYDVTKFAHRHPGGEKIITGYAGQDASDAWYAFHINKPHVTKFMKPLLIGRIQDPDIGAAITSKGKTSLVQEFRELRTKAETMGLFSPSTTFFTAIMLHILFFEFLGWLTLRTFGTGWAPYLIAGFFLTVAQIQAGWSQHDYGHLSVFSTSRLNHWMHIFMINIIKGASSHWWNFRHFNHHSKPNVLQKDPDITLAPLFVVGNAIASEYGKKKKKYLPYAAQHKYFFFTLPPLLLPLYFNLEIPYFLIKRRLWWEVLATSLFFLRWQMMFSSMLGVSGVFLLFLYVRFIESHWFVWATQMSHIPMPVDYDSNDDWVTTQVRASCNVESSWFNDWWSGHLNFQIEHHLFPTMPRHNLTKVAPYVQEMCRKHGLDYQKKSLFQAFADIVTTLKSSGETWLNAYNM